MAETDTQDASDSDEKSWLWCQRRLDQLDAQVEILRRRINRDRDQAIEESEADMWVENALLRAENQSLKREIASLKGKDEGKLLAESDIAVEDVHDPNAKTTGDAQMTKTTGDSPSAIRESLNDDPNTSHEGNLSGPVDVLDALHQAVARLPSCATPRNNSTRPFRLRTGEKLDVFLAEAAPKYDWAKLIFFFPARTIPCKHHAQHYLTFAPRAQEIPNTNERITARFNHLLGQKRHLFVGDHDRQITYAGLYVIKRMAEVAPQGCKLPIPGVDASMIASQAERDVGRKPKYRDDTFPSRDKFRAMYIRGELQVEGVGLECVGFDEELDERIERLYADREASVSRKRRRSVDSSSSSRRRGDSRDKEMRNKRSRRRSPS